MGGQIIEVDDDDPVRRRNDDILPATAAGGKRTATDLSQELHFSFRHPPHVAVAEARPYIRIGPRAFRHPCGRDDLLLAPFSAIEVEPAEACEVASAEAHGIGGVVGCVFVDVTAIRRYEVLHLQQLREMFVDGREGIFPGRAPQDRAEHIEVPVVVIPERSRCMAAAVGTPRSLRPALVSSLMIDAGSSHQELANGGLRLLHGEAGRLVVAPKLTNSLVEIDLMLANPYAVS